MIVLALQPCLADDTKEVKQAIELEHYHRRHDAKLHLDNAIKQNPNDLSAHLHRGRILLQLDDPNGALSDSEFVIKVDGTSAWAYEIHSRAMYDLGKPEQAIADMSKSIELSKEARYKKGRLYTRAQLYRYIKQPKKALPDLAAALAIEKTPTKNFYYQRGNAYYDCGDYKKAVDDVTSALALMKPGDPEQGFYHGLRARSYLKMGRKDLAEPDLRKANMAAKNELGDMLN
jgi:tetratricopeptide (TPR) repeat protein